NKPINDDAVTDALHGCLGDTEGPFRGQRAGAFTTEEKLEDVVGDGAFFGACCNRDAALEVLIQRGGDVAARALKKIEPILLIELKDNRVSVRYHALVTLSQLGGNGGSIAPGLEALLKDTEL